MTDKYKFPKNFLWGAGTSAHQVEGGNKNDWSEWEKKNADDLAKDAPRKFADWQIKKFPEMLMPENYISGAACDHYNQYERDFDIAKELGHNAHRFSIEWSRIEPEEGKFNEKEIEHYRKVIRAIKDRGMEPFVTIWHWTIPLWLRDVGGWENKKTIDHFTRYVEKTVQSFPEVSFWTTLNEPTVYTSLSYIKGTQPPGKKNIFKANRSINNLIEAHCLAYDLIHSINKDAMVSVAYSINYWVPYKNSPQNKILSSMMNFLEGRFLKKIKAKADFIGIQYYRSITIGFKLRGNFFGIVDNRLHSPDNVNDLDWKIYPEGIYYFLKKLGGYKLPIYITENGIPDADDRCREKFISDSLYFIGKAMAEGVDVRGYFHWSLLDNFEFVEVRGFWPRFGLVEMDYKTMERKIRPSALVYKKIILDNSNKT